MSSAARADRAARPRTGTGVLVMALAALAAAVLTCWPGSPAQPQALGLSPVSGAAPAAQVADWRHDGDAGSATGVSGAGEHRDHCAPCPADHDGTHCGPHVPDGNLNSASPVAPSVDDESGPRSAPRRLTADYGAAGPPTRAPDLHLLQLLRV